MLGVSIVGRYLISFVEEDGARKKKRGRQPLQFKRPCQAGAGNLSCCLCCVVFVIIVGCATGAAMDAAHGMTTSILNDTFAFASRFDEGSGEDLNQTDSDDSRTQTIMQEMIVDLFGDKDEKSYGQYIQLMDVACDAHTLASYINATGQSLSDTVLGDLADHPNATIIERFIRANILPTRNTILVAFTGIMVAFLSATIPAIFADMLAEALIYNVPAEAVNKPQHVLRRQASVLRASSGGRLFTLMDNPLIKAVSTSVGMVLALMESGTLLFSAAGALVAQALVSFSLLYMVYKSITEFWGFLIFTPDCNALLAARYLSYHQIFGAITLACASIFDLVLSFLMMITICGTCLHGCCYIFCCVHCFCDFLCCRLWTCHHCINKVCCQCFHCFCYCVPCCSTCPGCCECIAACCGTVFCGIAMCE